MRAYRLSNNDVVIDIRPYVSSDCHGTKQLLKCIKIWCHKREGYCFKVIVTDKPVIKRLNPAETSVAHRQLAIAVATGEGEIVLEEVPEEPWYNRLKKAMPQTVQEILP